MDNVDIYKDRSRRVRENMRREGLEQIVISAVPSIFWLTGLWIEPHERMLAVYLDVDGRLTLFGNRLFAIDETDFPFECVLHSDGDKSVKQLATVLKPGKVGVDKLWQTRFLLELIDLRPDIKPCLGSAPVDAARMRKDGAEIELMRTASEINDKTMEAAARALREGMTEAQLAAFIMETYSELGADFPVGIQAVCFGKNASDPHHMPDKTALKAGCCVLLDIFTPVSRYWCDMTRTMYFRAVSKEEEAIYEIVRRANAAAIAAVRPGIPMKRIDAAARDIISDAGCGKYFIHRLGHGAGLECHEPPDCSAASEVLTEPGMVFSIEPGVYLPGKFGVRIEDLVLVTETGCEVMNHFPKEINIVY
ncbi:MAG: Xaa-Pro peptidase family protein [Clostridiales Family XIII bacterium]|jgi:Xaa-Pro dipeptidase|nr:Xaa-Pro peptidase family protein [Clostridiales Family XIII bacterium]